MTNILVIAHNAINACIAGDHEDRPYAAMRCIDAIADVVVTNDDADKICATGAGRRSCGGVRASL
jgi:hypothetical protein